MQALISPLEQREFIIGWDESTMPETPIVVKGYRVAQVEPDNQIFVVAEPFFWMDCADDVKQDTFYFDTDQNAIVQVPDEKPYPPSMQPKQKGLQTV